MVDERGEGDARAQREPVPEGIDPALVVARQLVGQVRGRVPSAPPVLVADVLVPSGEGDGLESGPADLVVVLHAEIHDRSDGAVVEPVHDGDDGRDLDAGRVQVVDRDLLDVEEVGDVAVRVGLVGDAVELEVGHVEAGLLRLERELRLEGEAQAVRRRLDHLVADLLRVGTGLDEVRREGRLSARELDRHLPPRLERDGVVQDLLDLVHGQLVDVADLVGVHEARVAHHVAAVGQVDREHGPPPVLDRRRAVAVHELIAEGLEVTPGEAALDPPAELGVDLDEVLEGSVVGTALPDPDLAVLLVQSRADLADVAVDQLGHVPLPTEDLAAGLDDAARAERVRLPRVAERRPRALV
jgi:hypothetical protein